MVSFWRPFGRGLKTKLSPKSIKKQCRETPEKQDSKIYQFWVTLGIQKCTKSVPGMVEMMPWAPLAVSRRPQWHQKPPRKAPGGVRRSISISFYQFGRHGGGKAEGNWIILGGPWDDLRQTSGELRFNFLQQLCATCGATLGWPSLKFQANFNRL